MKKLFQPINHNTGTRRSLTRDVLRALLTLALLGGTLTTTVGADRLSNPKVFPPNSKPYGQSYAEWAAQFWQWSLSFPITATPANDTAPLSTGQFDHVWFLPSVPGSATVTRHVSIPAGVALFTPALSVYFNNADCPVNTTFSEDELLAQANGAWDFAASLTACTIDGVAVKGLEDLQETAYRVQTSLFYLTVAHHDNLIAASGTPCFPDGGTIDTVAVGAFLMVKPLPVGRHTIRVVGVAGPLEDPFFAKDATYEITVTP